MKDEKTQTPLTGRILEEWRKRVLCDLAATPAGQACHMEVAEALAATASGQAWHMEVAEALAALALALNKAEVAFAVAIQHNAEAQRQVTPLCPRGWGPPEAWAATNRRQPRPRRSNWPTH